MDQHNSLEITDRDGWCKTLPFQKRLIHIGSDLQNDIVLESWRGTGVASRHLQLIVMPAPAGGFRLVNLGDTSVSLGVAADRVVAPRSSADITDGEHIQVGEFTLVLRGGQAPVGTVGPAPGTSVTMGGERPSGPTSTGASSRVVGLELLLPHKQLQPDRPIEGSVLVRNLGDQPAVQFKLAVDGLPADCYEIGTGPILFPNAEKEIYFRLIHTRGPNLLAGDHRFSVRAQAPEAYPGESATVSETVHVLPFYSHALRLVTTE